MENIKKVFLQVFMLMLVAVLVIGCSSSDGEKEDETAKDPNKDSEKEQGEEVVEVDPDLKQEITFATISDPVGLSPVETWDSVSDQPINQMYDRLFETDLETGEIVPHLALSYENVDDLTWIFKLREGVKFHDGTPFNAEAVKYTFEKLVSPETAAPGAHIMSFLDEIEAVDEFTVRLKTKEPSPNVLTVLTNRTTAIISPDADQKQNLMQDPVGTGPFKFESWVQGDRLVMVRNDDYWGEPAILEKITFVTVPDQSTAISMLATGEVDFIDSVEAQNMQRLESMNNIDLLQTRSTAVYFFSFNTEKEPMNDPQFRKAVAQALDIDSYLSLLDGLGFKSYSLFGPSVIGYDDSIEASGIEYDLESAKKIIEENGYGDKELKIYTADRAAYLRMAEVAQAQLTEAGLNVSLEMMEWGTLLDTTSQGEQDMFVLGSSNSMNGLETLYGYFHTNSVGVNNRTQYSNPYFDEVISNARTEMDEDKRQDLINESHRHIVEEAVMIPMHHSMATLAHVDSIDGIILTPQLIFELRKAYRK